MTEQNEPRTRQDIEAHIIAQAWKNEAYKQELLSNPKAVIGREFGITLPAEVTVQVVEETPTQLYLSLPARPDLNGTELSEEQLEAVAGGITWTITTVTIPFVHGAVEEHNRQNP